MSVLKARAVAEELGMPRPHFDVLAEFLMKHKHDSFKGGQHTNGGCGHGRCDYGSEVCAAWTELCAVLGTLR